MNAVYLIRYLNELGIRIEAHGDRLRYAPRSAVTPDLADRMTAHKGELLAMLSGEPGARDERRRACEEIVEWTRPLDADPRRPTRTVPPPASLPCGLGHNRFWKSSIGKHLVCGTCHPPVCEGIVEKWITYCRRCWFDSDTGGPLCSRCAKNGHSMILDKMDSTF